MRWAALFACGIAAISVAFGVRAAHQARDAADARVGGYRIGEQFDHREMLSADHSQTLVVWLDPECRACVESATFYRHLFEHQWPVALAVASPAPTDKLDAFLTEHSIRAKAVHVLEGESSLRRLGLVPTLMLVGSTGSVARRWVGKLTASQEEEVVQALSKKVGYE